MYGCVGSSFLREGFPQLRQVGATLHRGARASHYRGLSLRSTGFRCAGSVVVAHGPSCSAACGILPDQGSNPCPLHQQADSQPPRHQGSPKEQSFKMSFLNLFWGLWNWLSNLTRVKDANDSLSTSKESTGSPWSDLALEIWKISPSVTPNPPLIRSK